MSFCPHRSSGRSSCANYSRPHPGNRCAGSFPRLSSRPRLARRMARSVSAPARASPRRARSPRSKAPGRSRRHSTDSSRSSPFSRPFSDLTIPAHSHAIDRISDRMSRIAADSSVAGALDARRGFSRHEDTGSSPRTRSAADRPAMAPDTTHSVIALPPIRFAPWRPHWISPQAKSPSICCPAPIVRPDAAHEEVHRR